MERGGGGADAPCSHCWAKVLRWEMVLCAHHGNPTNERLRCKKNRSHPPSSTLFLRSFWLQARRPLCWPLPFCFDTYRLFFVLPRWTRILLIYDELAKAWPSSRHCGRVVKAIDQKSIGFIPRRFESCQCRPMLHSCPSGLRGSTQVRVYSYSWVQIPPNAYIIIIIVTHDSWPMFYSFDFPILVNYTAQNNTSNTSMMCGLNHYLLWFLFSSTIQSDGSGNGPELKIIGIRACFSWRACTPSASDHTYEVEIHREPICAPY